MMIGRKYLFGLVTMFLLYSYNVYAIDKTYSTDFSLTEDRISEGGNLWINGAATGLDWTNVKTSNGNATGTMNRLPDGINLYDDSVAILKGDWGADQTVEAVVYAANRTGSDRSGYDGNEYSSCNKEVELILRGDITANSIKLYEILFSSRIDGTSYHQIVRWNGPRGDFTVLYGDEGWQYEVADGDVITATMIGSTITVYLNDELVSTTTDTTFSSGKPGIGFYSSNGCTGTVHNDDFGFKSFVASAPEARVPQSPSIISVR
jgi:hypothetical protein